MEPFHRSIFRVPVLLRNTSDRRDRFPWRRKSVDGKVHPAFVLYINGCQTQGNESMGKEIGTILQKDIPEFLVTLGKTVALSGQDFHTWRNANPEELERMAADYLIA